MSDKRDIAPASAALLYETVKAAILKETQKSIRDHVRIHFLNDGSRKLAEKYFNARKLM
ncbi:hypothetical protein D3C71_157660 [compost metagenome]